jgi:hypothetical protein
MRNLMFRFLMYNYTRQARRLAARLREENNVPGLLGGNKGRLARLSLSTGINFLAGARLLVQTLTRCLLSPWWHWKYLNETGFDLGDRNGDTGIPC